MAEHIKIPVWVAILININIVIGSAFFLGAGKISAINGILAPFAWLLCGLLLLPLVITLARLALHYPAAGGLYIYSRNQLGSLWGFLSGWGYFIGTAAANAAVLHAFSIEIQKLTSVDGYLNSMGISGIPFDVILVLIFTAFNLFNIEFLEYSQIFFAALKAIPLIIILASLPFLFNSNNLVTTRLDWSGLLETLPLVLFAYIGIEACCAISDKLHNGEKSASRVILISFGLIMAIYMILQFSLLCIHGANDINPFLSLMPLITSNPTVIAWGNTLIYIAILSSFLGGFYGMFYYNNWNLYAIGNDKSIIGAHHITKTSKSQSPWVCVLIQSALVIIFLLTIGHNYYLITMSDFGTTLAYLLSVFAFLSLSRSITGIFALVSCGLLLIICTKNLFSAGIGNLLPFVAMLLIGLVAHAARHLKGGAGGNGLQP